MPWQDYGLAGLIVGALMALFGWWMRAARSDLRDSQERFAQDLKESHNQFVGYLTTTGERQTEAIVSSAVTNQQSTKALEELSKLMNRHDERAEFRHQQTLERLDRLGGKNGT